MYTNIGVTGHIFGHTSILLPFPHPNFIKIENSFTCVR